jgi:hypothetical protein
VRLLSKKTTTRYTVAVTVPPEGGKANNAVVTALAEHFDIAKSRIVIIMGGAIHDKIVEIS